MIASSSAPQKNCLHYADRLEGLTRRYRTSSLIIVFLVVGLTLNLNRTKSFEARLFTARESDRGIHPPILYGHVHMAKTGGTSLNGILANRFEHVCGHKGYSYDAFQDNERAKKQHGVLKETDGDNWSRSRINPVDMEIIGFEDCDYITHETNHQFWIDNFGDGKFHGTPMELHVPCRNRIEHLMSQCNYNEVGEYIHHPKRKIACDAKTDEELFESVNNCFLFLNRYDHELLNHFDVKCFDFDNQFTTYVQYMSGVLNGRRYESEPYVKRETNEPRNRADECIWSNPSVLEKVDKYLLDTVPYYQFCNNCLGSSNQIAL